MIMGIFDGMNDIFGVGNTISQSSNIQPDDVLKTKNALSQTGHYQVPDFGITDIPDMGMIDGLKGFQQDNDLKVDGVMKPGGPTETKLGETLAHQGIGNMDLLEQSKSKTPKIDPLTGVEEVKMPKLKKPTKAQWDQVAEMQKPKQTPWFQSPKIQPVEDEAHSANTRTMDGLLKYSVNGSLPYLYANSIKNGGDKAVNEYANFMQQLNDRKGDRVETFHQEVMDRLPETHKQKFAALEVQDDRHETPLGQDNGNEHAQRFQTTSHQLPENDQAGPSHYRTASTETSFSQPTAAAMMVESNGDDKTSLAHPYDNGEAPTQRRYNRRKNLGERRLDATEDRLRAGSKIGRKLGMDGAADHLDHFLDGDGSDREVHRDEARNDPFIRRAEEENRKQFEDNTFLAQPSKSQNPQQRRRKQEQNRRMRNLKEGESMYVDPSDTWDQDQTDREKFDDYGERIGHGGADDFWTYGTQKMRSTPEKVKVTRRGNKLHIEGTVEHNADDRYDFDKGSSGDWSGAYELQEKGRAKPYTTRRRWKQRVSGTVDIDGWEDGKGHVLRNPKMKWDDFE
jgi:hypothetical protein